jgi:hypothetical protein
MQQQRMHADEITGRGGVFHHLKRYVIDHFDPAMKAGDTLRRSTGRAKIVQVGMALQGFAQLRGTRARCRRMQGEPPAYEAVRAADDVGAAATHSHVGEHGVNQKSAWRRSWPV